MNPEVSQILAPRLGYGGARLPGSELRVAVACGPGAAGAAAGAAAAAARLAGGAGAEAPTGASNQQKLVWRAVPKVRMPQKRFKSQSSFAF